MGDAPTWLATAGAFVAVVVATKALKVERRRDRQALRRELAEQANLIAVWTSPQLINAAADPGLPPRMAKLWVNRWYGGVRITNNSQLPIYGCRVTFCGPQGELLGSVLIDLLPPGVRDMLAHDIKSAGGPDLPALMPLGEESRNQANWKSIQADIMFKDASGVVWHRATDGGLSSFNAEPPARGLLPSIDRALSALLIEYQTRRAGRRHKARQASLDSPETTEEK